MSPLRCAILLSLFLSACGYRPLVVAFPEGEGRIVIPLAGNDTAHHGIVGPFTDALRLKTQSAGIRVVSSDGPRLIAQIVAITSGPGMLARDGDDLYPIDKIQTIVVRAHIEDPSGNILVPEETFEASGRSLAGDNVRAETALEADRRVGILDTIADMIVSYMFAGG